MASRSQPVPDTNPSVDRHRSPSLWVELEVAPAPGAGCPVSDPDVRTSEGTIQLLDGTCHVTVEYPGPGGGVDTLSTGIEPECVCTDFCGPGCVPGVLDVEQGRVVIGAYVDDRDRLAESVGALAESGADVELRRLTAPDADSRPADRGIASFLEAVPCTEKQIEAVELAVEMGYYRQPREASLEDLAGVLDVSRSAFSQRLNAVESKLVRTLASEL